MAYNNYGGPSWQPQPYYYQNQPQQSYAPMQPVIPQKPIFVDGEMAARVFQMPENWPIGVPLYLWDSNGDYFYVKMLGPNGVPAPLQAFYYQRKDPEPTGYISGNQQQIDTSQFVTKDDLNKRFDELKDMMRNQNGGNRGVNK